MLRAANAGSVDAGWIRRQVVSRHRMGASDFPASVTGVCEKSASRYDWLWPEWRRGRIFAATYFLVR